MYYNGLVPYTGEWFGVLPGAFNPPTEAHLALAKAALQVVDQVIFVLPRTLPHKSYSGVPFQTRLELLREATAHNGRFAVTTSEGGLLIEIARELRPIVPPDAELHFLCGKDAAERIVNWNYETPETFRNMLEEFHLLVAPRAGDYIVPEHHRERIATLPLAAEYQVMSATEVRERIRDGREWRHLVPAAIQERVLSLYRSGEAGQML